MAIPTLKNISQTKISLFVSAYIGVFLNFPVFFRRRNIFDFSETFRFASFLVEAVCVFLMVFALIRLISTFGERIFRVLVTALVFISAAGSYYMIFSNVVIGYGVIASVLAVTDELSKESIGYLPILWTVLFSIPCLFPIWRYKLSNSFYENFQSKKLIIRWAIGFFAAVFIPFFIIKTISTNQKVFEKNESVDFPSYGGVVFHSFLPFNWISSLGIYAYVRFMEARSQEELFDPAKHFTYMAPDNIDQSYVVFIIGETTRSDHLGVLGYERNTTPLLSKEKNLVALKGISCDTATKLSLRCMFVRKGGAEDNEQRSLKEKNVFSVLKSLGFSSDLYAMQSELWFYTKTNADSIALREIISAKKGNEGKGIDDMLLIPAVQESIRNHPHGKHLIILHTKGSHYLYTHRYPREFAVYTPECHGIDSFCKKQELINSFDNSVLYMDTFIKTVIDQFRDKNAIVFYAADHGESIEENTHFHAPPRHIAPPDQFKVPIIVWASDKFLADPRRREGFDNLNLNKERRVRHEEIFDSVLGCLGFTSPNGGINQANNWCAVRVVNRAP